MPYLILTGPTASGKSKIALELATMFNGIILNADSMQWYQDLPILTAQPTENDKASAPHHLYGVLDVHATGSAHLWQEMAVKHIQDAVNRLVIVVGGTGLYLRSLTHGLSPVISIPEAIRIEVRTLSNSMETHEFRTIVLREDPLLAQDSPPVDRQRLARALEVKRATGKSIRTFQGQAIPPLPAPLAYIIHSPEKIRVRDTINQRSIQMLEEESLHEINTFWAKNPPPSCLLRKAIGLNPITAFINKEISYEAALELTQIQTRQYAKRQRTWFNGQSPSDAWFNPTIDAIIEKIKRL